MTPNSKVRGGGGEAIIGLSDKNSFFFKSNPNLSYKSPGFRLFLFPFGFLALLAIHI